MRNESVLCAGLLRPGQGIASIATGGSRLLTEDTPVLATVCPHETQIVARRRAAYNPPELQTNAPRRPAASRRKRYSSS